MRTLSFALLAFTLAAAASCSDDDKTTPPVQSASGVFPAQAFLGRKLRVEISGDNTSWADGATVSMGDGITVDAVTVSSPTAIFADITVADTAAEGTNDVTVTDGGESVVLTKAFRLVSPIEFTTQGTIAQGSIATFTIKNRDLENLFDTTSTGDGFFTPIVFTNVDVQAPPGVNVQINNVTPFDIEGFLLIDVDAAPAGGTITLKSGPTGEQISSPAGAPLAVMARTPVVLTAGTPAMGMIANPFDSALYSFAPSATPAFVHLTVTNPDATVNLAVLPASGHFADLLTAAAPFDDIAKTGSYYLIPYDLSGNAGYQFTLRATATTLAPVADTEPGNNTSTGATAGTAATLVDSATLAADDDQDWFKITVPAGKKIHVVTRPGDPQTDTLVDIYGPAVATQQTHLIQSNDQNYHENVTSAAVSTAGTYFVEISVSSFGLVPGQTHYDAAILLE
jgi:hypothetical protein